MDVKISRVDLEKTRENWPVDLPFEPAAIFKQPSIHPLNWIVLGSTVTADPLVWSHARRDAYVRIPLFSYELSGTIDVAFATMFKLGIQCAARISSDIAMLHIITGAPVDLISENGINDAPALVRHWFGFAFVPHT